MYGDLGTKELSTSRLCYRKNTGPQVLRIAHALPIAGHLGKQKTAQCILRRFYLPSVFKDMEKYCRQCPECQLVGEG